MRLLLLLVQKLKIVGINKSNKGNHIEILRERAMKVNMAEHTIHTMAIRNI
jgi:hypothetical protein